MNLKEYAEEKGISLAEAKKQTGLTHWKQEVTISVTRSNPNETIMIPVVETESKEAPALKVEKTPEQMRYDNKVKRIQYEAEKLKRVLGTGNRRYLKYVSLHRNSIPAEYEEAKEQIKRAL